MSEQPNLPMLIGGERRYGDDRIAVLDPADEREVVGWVPRGDGRDVNAAVAAAQAAFPGWAATPTVERAAALRRAAEVLDQDVARRGELLSRENGQIVAEAERGVGGASRALRWYADALERFEPTEELPSATGRVIVEHQPVGVVALIVPWNAPTNLAFMGIAPILAAGNTVVVKPPSDAPLTVVDMLLEVAPLFPPGVVNIVSGSGETVGQVLCRHPHVRRINFTGSTESGKEVMRAAAGTIKRLGLELGGNDPAIVLEDADLDRAVHGLFKGVFAVAGQLCYLPKRIYVHEALFDAFVGRFSDLADTHVVGRGTDRRSTMGPLVSRRQRDRLAGLVNAAKAQGASVRTLGTPLEADLWEHGAYHLPTVVTGVSQAAQLVQVEQFGPAIPILPFGDVDEAIELANDSPYGLTSSIWTEDEDAAFALARRLESGSTFVNAHQRGVAGTDMPFGGMKESGLGRGHGMIALEEQFELHTISSRRPAG